MVFRFNEKTIEIDGYNVTFKVAGMTEFYDLIKSISGNLDESKATEIERLNKLADKRNEGENKRILELQNELSGAFIASDIASREFIMNHALLIEKDGVQGGIDDARLFIDTRDSNTLAEILNQIKPDIEKNLQSQS